MTGVEDLVLREPRADDEQEFVRAYEAASDSPFFASYRRGMRFEDYLEWLAARNRGEIDDPGQVPATFLLAFSGTRIVGRVSIRHSLNESLSRRGGHIGYVVVPEFRRRGYATAMLRMSLRIARERLGLHRVLVTCDADNIGSIKTIERNGGVLEALVTDTHPGEKPFLRYWIHNSEETLTQTT